MVACTRNPSYSGGWAGESLESRRQRLLWAEIEPLHSTLGNKRETASQKKKRKEKEKRKREWVLNWQPTASATLWGSKENRKRTETENLEHVNIFRMGEEAGDGEEKMRKVRGRIPTWQGKRFQKEKVANCFRHYREVKQMRTILVNIILDE